MRILQIIPNAPEVSCGVGDYAQLLAARLSRDFDIHSQYLVPRRHDSPAAKSSAPLIYQHPSCDKASLIQCLESLRRDIDTIVLQFSPYGYQRRGIPLGLTGALQAILRQHPKLTLHTMFHELYASGPITTSSFWLGFLQKAILRRLATLSRHRFTNRSMYARWIESASPLHSSPVAAIPVFSNLGEAASLLPPSARPATMALFRSGIRSEIDWQALRPHLEAAQISQIHSIGREDGCIFPPDFPYKVTHHGHLAPAQISSLLQGTRLGYLDYYPGYLGKSGIFAAYAAHGVPVVFKKDASSTEDGLRRAKHYTLMHGPVGALQALDEISAQAAAWYAPHNLQATATRYASALRPR